MARCIAVMALVACLLAPLSVRAQFGGGTQIVFDPSMFARQLQQLQQETQTVLTEAQQLQYMIRNTTGGYAGVWQSSQSMLDELGGLTMALRCSRQSIAASGVWDGFTSRSHR